MSEGISYRFGYGTKNDVANYWRPKKKQPSNPKKNTMSRYMRADEDCPICHGLGLQYFADWFDRDNGSPCPLCEKMAKEQKKKLLLPYTR